MSAPSFQLPSSSFTTSPSITDQSLHPQASSRRDLSGESIDLTGESDDEGDQPQVATGFQGMMKQSQSHQNTHGDHIASSIGITNQNPHFVMGSNQYDDGDEDDEVQITGSTFQPSQTPTFTYSMNGTLTNGSPTSNKWINPNAFASSSTSSVPGFGSYASPLPPNYPPGDDNTFASTSTMNGGIAPSPSRYPQTGGAMYPGQAPNFELPGDAGKSSSSAIDIDRLPTPPPDPRKPVCIGALISRAIMLYPSPAAVIGTVPPIGSKERYDIVPFRGAEFLRIKLKLREKGSKMRKDEPWTGVAEDTIQVLTPSLITYLGDLDQHLQDILIPHMKRGLLRLEGYVQRLQPDAPQFEVRLNVLLFTLPSNVSYISQSLLVNSQYLLDPVPPYEPTRHADAPEYKNAHGGQEAALRMMQLNRSRSYGNVSYGHALGALGMGQMDKAKQVEIQRKQVDEVFKSLDSGIELDQSDPGPLIKTELFPHQRKALTFFLQRECDWSSLKKARKYAEKSLRKSKISKGTKAESAGVEAEKDKENESKDRDSEKSKGKDPGRVLWEAEVDEKGRTKSWTNKITREKRKHKKGESPNDGKGAILADDMGLGKTLSVVSLIAATRAPAKRWGRSKPASAAAPAEEVLKTANGDIKSTDFKSRVFGMPSVESDDESTSKGKKRKREETDTKLATSRANRIYRRSKATLLVCPMSTITNWEDQIKEHWNGKVEIVGGQAGILPSKVPIKKWKPPKKGDSGSESDSDDGEDFDTLKIYIYHGSARRPDPDFIGDFDVVITSYNTLAQEFSKMNVGVGDDTETSTPGETATNSDEDNSNNTPGVVGDISLNPRATKPEVEAEIKATEIADAMRKNAKKKGKGAARIGQDQTSALQAIEWFRVVLDEAHYIKSASTVASKATCYLAADRRIALTGTPIQNKIEDVWALFKFLRLDPIDQKEVFNEYIWNPCKAGDTIGVAKLQLVMRCCTLRRTKDTTAEDGRRILNLPPKKEIQLWLDLRPDERKVYDDRINAVKERVGDLQATNQLGKNYANVLQEVLRLRQICDHVDLAMLGTLEEDYDGTIMDYEVAVKGIEANGLNLARAQSIVAFQKDGDGAICTICGFDYGDYFPSVTLGGVEEDQLPGEKGKLKKLVMTLRPILTKCLHMFCPKCFKDSVYSDYSKRMKETAGRACGACEAPLRIPTDIIEVYPPDDSTEAEQPVMPLKRHARKKYIRPIGEKPDLSTKMQYLQEQLLDASRKNPNSVHYDSMAFADDIEELDADGKPLITKSVVFSQWTTMLDRIGDMLDEINIKYSRLDGTMTREDRAKAVEALRFNKKVEVLLVSTRAGGVGLNLTAASRCFLVDPYWNPSVEAQAIDRIHRMGQTRPVTAIKLMIKDSIEMKLDEIQRKKANLAQLSLKNMTRKELMAQRAEELASLFS